MQGARIRYTPTTAPEMGTETKRNMEVLLEADPAKSAGQGFGSAGQYLDVCIKTDTDTLDGYGLRIIRTAAHSDAVSMYLIQYVRGQAQCISREVVTNCFVTGCRIWVRYENGILSAKAWTVTNKCLSPTLYIYVFFANCKQIIFQRRRRKNFKKLQRTGKYIVPFQITLPTGIHTYAISQQQGKT